MNTTFANCLATHPSRQGFLVRFVSSSVALVYFLAASGCSPSESPKIVTINVDSTGAYTLNGRVVSDSSLSEELRTLQSSGSSLELEILASVDANHQAVGRAVVAAQSAKIARIRFVSRQAK